MEEPQDEIMEEVFAHLPEEDVEMREEIAMEEGMRLLYIFSDLYDMKKRAGFVDGFLRCHLPVLSKNTC